MFSPGLIPDTRPDLFLKESFMSRKISFGIFAACLLFSTAVSGGRKNPSEISMKKKSLYRTYSGKALKEIAFPLGGIGTGCVSLGGRGQLRDWEIFNRPDKGRVLDYTVFAVWAKSEGEEPVARILEQKYMPSYRGSGYRGAGHGVARRQFAGVPRLEKAEFKGEYPFARIDFQDGSLPVRPTLEAWNPLIPLNVKDSSLPIAIFEWTFRNPTDKPVEISMSASISNPIGDFTRTDGKYHGLGGNLNEYKENPDFRGLNLTSPTIDEQDPAFGSMALVTTWKDLDVQTRWYRGGWYDKVHIFWDDFSDDGRLADVRDGIPSEKNKTDYGCIVLHATIEPHGTVKMPVLMAWHFPNRENYWNGSTQTSDYWTSQDYDVYGKLMKNYVAAHFRDAWDVAGYAVENRPRLEAETRAFHDTLFSSTLPAYVLDAVSSQMSTLKTNVCLLLEDGSFFGFEGSSDNAGCCPMNCTHVWNYEQTLAWLFPQLERSMRETDFLHNTFPNGLMAFRTILPLGPYWWHYPPAADGQMGSIMGAYREWQLSGDTEWLRKIWPGVKSALEFAWKGCGDPLPSGFEWTAEHQPLPWDLDKTGVMDGKQHNTYDIEFYGPNTLTGSLYLGALKAGAEMAEAMGENRKADEYRKLYEQGRKEVDRTLWNGEYYIQDVSVDKRLTVPEKLVSPPGYSETAKCACNNPPGGRKPALEAGEIVPKYQYGKGCLSDQLLGQYLAHVAGLEYVLDPDHVKKAVKSIYDYNFRSPIGDYANVQRVFALNDESGLLLCSWPKGERPALPFIYSDEVWTGIEYQVAATLIYNGWVEEGLKLVESVRDRYKGTNRNPWDEEECGHHYARAMASWAVLLSLSGFQYSGVKGTMAFSPVVSQNDFHTFWSCGSGWGSFVQNIGKDSMSAKIAVKYGKLELRKLELAASGISPGDVTAEHGTAPLDVKQKFENGRIFLDFEKKVRIESGTELSIRIRGR